LTPSPNNRAIIAAAGSRKTQFIIEAARDAPATRRILITTFTVYNCNQIRDRLQRTIGCVPPNVNVQGWFSFLINQAARPYQSALTGQIDYARSLNFKANRPPKIGPAQWPYYYFDGNRDFRPEGVAEFACHANQATSGRVIQRLEMLYDQIYIDELQDLAGFDLDFLDLLFASKMQVTVVGDPRQHTYATNRGPKNSHYRGHAMMEWLNQRSQICLLEERAESWRCNQEICDWADDLYPEFPKTTSRNSERTDHDGVIYLPQSEVPAYVETYKPTVLRWNKTVDTRGLPAQNMKASKGCTFDRVLIFPSGTILKYLKQAPRDPSTLRPLTLATLYVAVTRARHSVAFVVDHEDAASYGQQSLFDDTLYTLRRAS
jgi:DNA helicase-2/ATP-dependent DNA helicase PcrA